MKKFVWKIPALLSFARAVLWTATITTFGVLAGGMVAQGQTQRLTTGILITPKSTTIAGQATEIQLTLPVAVNVGSVQAVLNGNDVTMRFAPAACESGKCMGATLADSDGTHAGKNVLYVTAKTSDDKLLTARERFDLNVAPTAAIRMLSYRNRVATRSALGTSPLTSFLPPTVTFQTVNTGGWNGNTPWFQVGTQKYPTTPPCSSGSVYLILAFDRQTLTPYYGNGGGCAASGSDLAGQLSKLPANQLVVVGTLFNQSSDASLDTSSIGGTNYTKASNQPTGYVAIGMTGATNGAYENFAVVNAKNDPRLSTSMWPFATGVVQEDANGNYNYESSEVLEYWVDPFTQDGSADHAGIVTVAASAPQLAANPSVKQYRYLPPSANGMSGGGYWLLVLRRDLPSSPLNSTDSPCNSTPSAPDSQGIMRYTNCGVLYNTGNSQNPDSGAQEYVNLAQDINNIGPYDLAILAVFTDNSSGYPVCCGDPWHFTGNDRWYNSAAPYHSYAQFSDALQAVGGSARATLFYNFKTGQYDPTPAYTYIFSRDTGDPLAGHSAVSASAYSAAGQTGYIHGLLARNLNGLFQPFQTSQQANGTTDAANGPDYLMSQLATQQPITWPELSGTLLSGASSVSGQEAAYQYVSYVLLSQYYVKGVSGPHQDDIHYFFTGSNVNYINYHYFDPIALSAPAYSSGQFCWSGPSSSPYSSQVCFTPQDFTAVTQQLSTEVTYLTNVMNFMVTGPVNMKNLVATGNANMGLALTSAAANILADNLTPATSKTQVKANWGNILSMTGGIVSVAADIASDGSLQAAYPVLKAVNFWGGALGSAVGATGAGVAGLDSTTATSTGIPSRFISFTTTVGNLANSSLQNQMGIAFDTTLDSFLGDWGKLSVLGPKITDTSNATYYSPNQVAQDAAIQVLTKGAQRSFYMSLLSNFYGIYYFSWFSGVNPSLDFVKIGQVTNQPDMGFLQTGASNGCTPIFMPGSNSKAGVNNTAPPLGFVWTPSPPNGTPLRGVKWDVVQVTRSPSGVYNNVGRTPTFSPADFYVVGTYPPSLPNTTRTSVSFMPDSLTQQLFTTSGFSIPLDLFVGEYGPMQSNWADMTQSSNPLGWLPYNICSARPYPITRDGTLPKDGVGDSGGTLLGGSASTATQLTAPASVGYGTTATLQAAVTGGGSSLTSGQVIFLQDGTLAATVALDGSGHASFSAGGLSQGTHTFQALFAPGSQAYTPSESDIADLIVYTSAPDIALSLGAPSLTVSYGSTSASFTMSVQSVYGMNGNVQFSCSGLPVNMSCNFTPSSTPLSAGGTASTSVTIFSQSGTAPNSQQRPTAAAFLAPTSLLLLWIARRRKLALLVPTVCALLVTFGISGCAGGSTPSTSVRESGTKTILVSATCNAVTKSVPLEVNIQ